MNSSKYLWAFCLVFILTGLIRIEGQFVLVPGQAAATNNILQTLSTTCEHVDVYLYGTPVVPCGQETTSIEIVSNGTPPFTIAGFGPTSITVPSSPFTIDNISIGTYYVIIRDSEECTHIGTVTIEDNCHEGIYWGDNPGLLGRQAQNVTERTPFQVFPNPTRNILNIKDINQDVDYTSISIMDVSGKVMWTEENYTNSEISIDVSSLPNGIYIISTLDNVGNRAVKRFVKTK